MLIESLEISGVAQFSDPVRLGPLQPGLNILAQANEWGKSTIVHTLCRTLFDKYNSQTEEIRQMRPSGTSLSPRIELCFTAQGGRFRLIKKFLDGKSCELHRWTGAAWERTDESDRADQRVRELLGAPPLETQKAKPETWGFIRYLWCRQDDAPAWPCWDGDCGEQTRGRLADVSIDPLMRRLAARLASLGEEQFTSRGTAKKGSPLQLAEAEHTAADAELVALAQRRADLEQLDRQYASALAEMPRLDREKTERAAEATALRAEAEAAELMKREVAHAESEFQSAETALRNVHRDREALAQIAAAILAAEAAEAQSREHVEEARAAARRWEETLEQARAAARLREKKRTSLQEKLDHLRGLLQRRARAEKLASLLVAQNLVTKKTAELQLCEEQLAGLRPLSARDLQRVRELEKKLGEQRAQLSASGLSVRLEPVEAACVSPSADGVSAAPLEVAAGAAVSLQAVRALTLNLSGWGRVIIESGARETAQLQREIEEGGQALATLLAQAGAVSLAEAEAEVEKSQQARARRDMARAELAALLTEWKTPPALAAAASQAETELEKSRALFDFTSEEEKQSAPSLQKEEQSLAAAEAAARREEKAFAQETEHLRAELEKARAKGADVAQKIAGSAARLKALREQSAGLLARQPGGFEAAMKEAQDLYMRAEARRDNARSALPPQAETLAARAHRAAQAAAEAESAGLAQQREADRLKTLLEERGGEGLYVREAEAEERLESARERAAGFRRAGLAARLLGELIQRREQASIRAVLSPLEERLTQTFAQLTGVTGRRVWFDEHLAIQGVGARREELVSFGNLSRGAREQLLLALRAAIALEVTASEGPQCLVLDDVLVHTDAKRHENVRAFLHELSGKVQILLLTCHAERYQGLGHLVPVERGARS